MRLSVWWILSPRKLTGLKMQSWAVSLQGRETCRSLQSGRFIREPDWRQVSLALCFSFMDNKADIVISDFHILFFNLFRSEERNKRLPVGVLKFHKHHNRAITCNGPSGVLKKHSIILFLESMNFYILKYKVLLK